MSSERGSRKTGAGGLSSRADLLNGETFAKVIGLGVLQGAGG